MSQLTFSRMFLSLLLIAPGSAQVIEWARQFGTGRVDEPYAVATGPNSVYTGGETFGSFPGFTNAGGLDCFVTKLDTAGNPQWTVQFGTSSKDSVKGLAADATGVYVVGATDGTLPGQTSIGGTDAFVRKYDTDGNELWTRQFGTARVDEALGAALDATGFYVVGKVEQALPGQTYLNSNDAFLRKYSPTGTEIWTRQFGTGDADIAYGVAADTSGVYVAGSTGGNLAQPANQTDGFIRKYDANGTVVWTRQISAGPTEDIVYAVAVSSSGVYIAGSAGSPFPGQTHLGGLRDGWARKYDFNGNEQWTKRLGSSDEDLAYGIGATARWVYVAVIVGRDTLLQRYDPDGADTGAIRLETPDREYPWAVAVDGNAAYLSASKDGASLLQTPAGDLDALVLKVPHPPEITGISEAFNGQPGSAPTTWTAIYGTGLSSSTRTWDGAIQGTQLPTTLDGTSVSINGRTPAVFFVSPGQVNVLAPLDDTIGNVQVTLTNVNGTSPPFQIRKSDILPAFYAPFGEGNRLMVTAVALDGTLVGKPGVDPRPVRPARPGEIVQFFATGFGRTTPPAPSDQIFLGAPELIVAPRITIGGRDAALLGKGNLVSPGLYQFNLTIPDLADGDHAIVAEIGTVRSPSTVFLAVRR
ncbi:MAG: SBBP repeat-containing protein [Acidobacteriia bacterium]|nr:SBBP repeat-containing protein [Terriglobia bacterium]